MDLDGRRVMNLTCYDVEISLPEYFSLHTHFYIYDSLHRKSQLIGRLVACFKCYKSHFPYYLIISHKYSYLLNLSNYYSFNTFNTFYNINF